MFDKLKGGDRMIAKNKKGLSDIVTTVLIILLVAVAVAAVWAFVSPTLKGTGTQFTRAQVCVANQIDVTSCKAKALSATNPTYPLLISARRTLSDNVATLKSYKVEVLGGTTPSVSADLGAPPNNAAGYLMPSQSATVSLELGSGATPTEPSYTEVRMLDPTTGVGIADSAKIGTSGAQVKITALYENPDKSLIPCPSLPIACQLTVIS